MGYTVHGVAESDTTEGLTFSHSKISLLKVVSEEELNAMAVTVHGFSY